MVTAVPDFADPERLRARFVQQLPRAFTVEAEFGRLSAFQSLPNELDRSRGRVMVSRTFAVATPARGGRIEGASSTMPDVPSPARACCLGPYAGVSNADGGFAFLHLPRGDYELSLDTAFLPAAFAWDGRRQTVDVTPTSRTTANLLVAPLNAVHGRVYVDKNSNHRFDAGEGVGGVVVRLDDGVVATSAEGDYSFYNVWPGAHVVHLDTARLPANLQPAAGVERRITLGDDGPVTGVDFSMHMIGKPIQWRGIGEGHTKVTAAPARVVLVIVALAVGFAVRDVATQGTETVAIILPAAVSFAVTNVSVATNGTPSSPGLQFSSGVLKNNRGVRASVKADGDFVPPSGAAILASRVSWTTSNAVNGVGSNGTLSKTLYTQLFQANDNATSGRIDIAWQLAAPGIPLRSGAHALTLRWKLESIH